MYEAPLLDSDANVNACGDTFVCRSMLTNIKDVARVVVFAAFGSDAVITQRGEYYLGREKLPVDIIPSMDSSVVSVGRLCEGVQSKQNCLIFLKDEYLIADLDKIKEILMTIDDSGAVWHRGKSQNYLYPIDLSGPFNKTVLKPVISYHCAKGNDYWRHHKSLNHCSYNTLLWHKRQTKHCSWTKDEETAATSVLCKGSMEGSLKTPLQTHIECIPSSLNVPDNVSNLTPQERDLNPSLVTSTATPYVK